MNLGNLHAVLDPAPTPLCPAGHLPLKGGDQPLYRSRQSTNPSDWRNPACQPISPLEGEMSGRTEGGRGLHEQMEPTP